jgi:hypothetical protein
MTDALHFSRGIEVKRADVTVEGVFAGYASTFGGAPDRAGEVVAAGAFAKSLSEHKADGSMPGMLWAHDMREPIGRWTAFAEDTTGLRAHGKLTLGTTRGKEAHALMLDGALSLSIGYRVRKDGFERSVRVLKEIELLEVSLVAVPADPRARITSAKDLAGPADLQRVLQELGFSQREAKRITAGGWAALARQEPSPKLTQAAALLRKHATTLTKG